MDSNESEVPEEIAQPIFRGSEIYTQDRVNEHFRSEVMHWDELYKGTDLPSRYFQSRRAAVLDLIKRLSLPNGARVLEVGCGAGLTTVEMARRGYAVDAVDGVSEMVDLARKNAAEANITGRVSLSVGDAYSLQFANHSYDLVLAIGVIPWLQFPRKAIRELTRVAKPRGYLIITSVNYWGLNRILDPMRTPVLSPVRALAKKVLGFYDGYSAPTNQEPQMNMYSIKDFEAFIIPEGLESIRVVTVGFGPFTFFGKRILSDSRGVWLQEKLQRLAERNPIIQSTGGCQIFLAKKKPS